MTISPMPRAALISLLIPFFFTFLSARAESQTPQEEPESNMIPVVINEVQASNNETIADEDGDYEDWVELYNPGSDTVWLGGFGLSDDYDNLYRWVFPEGSHIGPDEFLLVWASGKDRRDPEAPLHAGFSIQSEGEEVILSYFTNLPGRNTPVIDELEPTPIPSDYSFGRYPDGTENWFLFPEPTPGAPNTTSPYEGITSGPAFSRDPGFYTDAFHLSIETEDPHARIHYTLDGSEPTTDSPVYGDSILIESREGEPNRLSTIPTSPGPPEAPAHWQPPDGPVFKGHVVRAIAVRDGYRQSDPVSGTWFVDPAGADRYSFPVLSIVTDSVHLFSDETGLFVPGDKYDPDNPVGSGNYNERGREWERPAHLTFIDGTPDNDSGTYGFSQNIGIRIHGGATRRYPQKSIRIYSRSDYDWNPDITWPLFPGNTKTGSDQPPDKYKRLILRSSGDDWFHTMFKDAMVQSLYSDRNVDQQAYRPAVVFINGEYWGIHNIRERYDGWYVETNYGIHRDDVVILTGNAEVNRGNPDDRDHYLEMRDYARDQDLSDPDHFDHVAGMMDVENYLKYLMMKVYAANADWPHNNIRFWRKRTDEFRPDASYGADGRWRWMIFDLDATFGFPYGGENAWWAEYDHNMLEWITGTGNPRAPSEWVNDLFEGLIENEEFRRRFVNLMATDLNTRFASSHVSERIDAFRKSYRPEIEEHIRRHQRSAGGSPDGWNEHIDVMLEFAEKRPGYMRSHILDHFDLGGTADLNIAVQGGLNGETAGHVRLDSTDIRSGTQGVPDDISQWTGMYFNDIPVDITAVPAEGYIFIEWRDQNGRPLDREDIRFENGSSHTGAGLRWYPEDDMEIVAVFGPAKTDADREDSESLPKTFRLRQNYPNPFNDQTNIPFELPERSGVVLDVFTADGRKVKRTDKGVLEPGTHTLHFNTAGMASGVYLYRMKFRPETRSETIQKSRKMTIIR